MDKLQRVPLREQVADAIRNAILYGELKPGDRVPEQELAERLGVSRLPVREAIRMLEQEGVLAVRPQGGATVAAATPQDLADGALLRSVLEQLAVEQGLERSSPEQWAELMNGLQNMLGEMREACERHDELLALEIDVRWHSLLVESSQNRLLLLAWRNLGLPSRLFLQTATLARLELPKRQYEIIKRHERLLDALRRRDPAECREAIYLHIVKGA